MDLERCVVMGWRFGSACGRALLEAENVGLYRSEQRIAAGIDETVTLLEPVPSHFDHEIEEIAALLSERSEQAVAGLEVLGVGFSRERSARNVALRRDVSPVFATGILHEEMHIPQAREGGEELEQHR